MEVGACRALWDLGKVCRPSPPLRAPPPLGRQAEWQDFREDEDALGAQREHTDNCPGCRKKVARPAQFFFQIARAPGFVFVLRPLDSYAIVFSKAHAIAKGSVRAAWRPTAGGKERGLDPMDVLFFSHALLALVRMEKAHTPGEPGET